jgi:hypothetical protein
MIIELALGLSLERLHGPRVEGDGAPPLGRLIDAVVELSKVSARGRRDDYHAERQGPGMIPTADASAAEAGRLPRR